MKGLEVMGREAPCFEQRHGERVADRELHCGRRRGCEAVGAGLFGAREREAEIGLLSERTLGIARDGDEGNREAARMRDDGREFGRLARPR